MLGPILPAEFLGAFQAPRPGNDFWPFRPRRILLVRALDPAKAKELAAGLQNEPARWLTIPGSDFVLATEPPKVEQKNEKLDLRFDIPEGAARLLLQRLARIQPMPRS